MPALEIRKLPFYWRLARADSKAGNVVDDYFPFSFDFDSENGLLIQKRRKKVLDALAIVYQQEYNIGYLQDANEIARPYGRDFIEYLDQNLRNNPSIESILEVGCGGCVVLASLRERGYRVLGVDSSPFAASEGRKKGIDVLTDVFPTKNLQDKFDLIYHVDVLEHIDAPVDFLKHHYQQLNERGIVVVNVPDATESILIGDISMAMHQHLNYFTEDSLRCTLQSAGFEVVSVNRAGYGGSLYAVGRRNLDTEAAVRRESESQGVFEQFNERAHRVVASFGTLVKRLLADRDCHLGFYVPLRTLPYLAAHDIKSGFRFFDDTGHWHRQEFDGVDVEIENFADLKRKPVTHMVIMSLTFGEVIKRKLMDEFAGSMQVYTLQEIAESSLQ